MAEPINRGGTWWHEQPDGSWLRWDRNASEWQPSTLPPPPQAPGDIVSPTQPPILEADERLAAGPFRDLESPARWTRRFLVLSVVLAALGLISGFMELNLIDRLETGELRGVEAQDAAEANDDRQGVIGSFQLIALVLTIIFLLKWFSRAYKNLPVLGAERLRFTTGWAIGAWFVPILNLMRPKAIMNDIWRASDPTLPVRQGQTWEGRPVAGIINWWWGVWIIANLSAVRFQTQRDPTLEDIRRETSMQIFSDVGLAVAGILLLYIIKAVTARQKERLALMAGAGAGPTSSSLY